MKFSDFVPPDPCCILFSLEIAGSRGRRLKRRLFFSFRTAVTRPASAQLVVTTDFVYTDTQCVAQFQQLALHFALLAVHYPIPFSIKVFFNSSL
jgi:hypothetical protein